MRYWTIIGVIAAMTSGCLGGGSDDFVCQAGFEVCNGYCVPAGTCQSFVGGPSEGVGGTSGGGPEGNPSATGGAAVAGPVASCPYPSVAAVAVLEEPMGPSPIDRLSLSFYSNGSLADVNGQACAPPNAASAQGSSCNEDYFCGAGCDMRVMHNLETDVWSLVLWDPQGQAGPDCAAFNGFYGICTPNCNGRQCGDDGCGSSCGTCPAGQDCATATGLCWDPQQACTDCIHNCSDLPGVSGNCCQCGTGCLCAGECASRCP